MRAAPVLVIAALSAAIYWLTRKAKVAEVEKQAAVQGEPPAPYITKGEAPAAEVYRWEPGTGYVLDETATKTENDARAAGLEKAFELLPIGG